jgi:two-component system, sensor histidine kinase and response regulator
MESKPIILIVDDIETNRELLNDIVTILGYEPLEAKDGLGALNLMDKWVPDLVLLDIVMPDIDGYEVLYRMKESQRLRHVPVIMITGIDAVDSAVHCLERGADDYMTKPVNQTLLKARIAGCLEKKRWHDVEQKLHNEIAQSYDSLLRAEQARDALVQMIVHDLNSPLTAIYGFAQIISAKAQEQKNDYLLEYSKKINTSVLSMINLTESILDVSKMENDKMPVTLKPINLCEVLKNICDEFQLLSTSKQIKFSYYCDQDRIMINADIELLRRTLQNLLSNAIKHTRRGTEVSCSIKIDGPNAITTISDNGDGIPSKYIDRVFDKFFQVESNKDSKKYGVGLGLAFCKMAIEAQGGRIWVESEQGKGSHFCINLGIHV